MRIAALSTLFATLFVTSCGDGDDVGSLVLRANGVNEARAGISSGDTADGWAVEFDHAVLALAEVRLRTMAGDETPVAAEPVVVELVPEPAIVFELDGIPAQRWDRFSYHVAPPNDQARNVGVDPSILDRMRNEGWSTYYEGRLVAPTGTNDADGTLVTEVPFEFGFAVEVDYDFCVSGLDGTNGVVVPLNSAADYEVTWHITHLFFDSFVEDSALRVEPLAARWDGSAALTLDSLDAPLGGLRAMDGGALTDQVGNPIIYIPGMTGANTLREFVAQGRPGHFNGLEGFCMTELRVLN